MLSRSLTDRPPCSSCRTEARTAQIPELIVRWPRPEGRQQSRERGRSRSRDGVHVERLENPQVTHPICARICARDAAGRIEPGEMPTPDTDAAPPVDRGQRDDGRRPGTADQDRSHDTHADTAQGRLPRHPLSSSRHRVEAALRASLRDGFASLDRATTRKDTAPARKDGANHGRPWPSVRYGRPEAP